MNKFLSKKWLGIPLVTLFAVLLGVASVAAVWSVSTTIIGRGTITVPTGTEATHGIQIVSASVLGLDFSGSLPTPAGGIYTKTIVAQVKNTGTNGTGTYSSDYATITSITLSGAPTGYTLSTDWSGTLVAGATSSINITLTSNASVVGTVTLTPFTITVSGSGS